MHPPSRCGREPPPLHAYTPLRCSCRCCGGSHQHDGHISPYNRYWHRAAKHRRCRSVHPTGDMAMPWQLCKRASSVLHASSAHPTISICLIPLTYPAPDDRSGDSTCLGDRG